MGNCHLSSECEGNLGTLTDKDIKQCLAANQRLRNKVRTLEHELRKFHLNTRDKDEELWPETIEAKFSASREEDHCEISPLSHSRSSCCSSRVMIEDDTNFDWTASNLIRGTDDDRVVVDYREKRFRHRLSVSSAATCPVLSQEKIVWV
eukprot:jgi/Bigna1/62216/fgenesh1_kg.32_\